MCVSAATFGLDSLNVALHGGLLGQGYCVERLSLLKVETVEIFFMLLSDDFILLFPKRPQVRNMYARLCSDLACVSNSQSSYVVVEK